jgi:hypothetical protein
MKRVGANFGVTPGPIPVPPPVIIADFPASLAVSNMVLDFSPSRISNRTKNGVISTAFYGNHMATNMVTVWLPISMRLRNKKPASYLSLLTSVCRGASADFGFLTKPDRGRPE